MALAVLDKRARMRLGEQDVYAATVGGMRVIEPAADLAVALAVASAYRDVPIPAGLVVLGEVGLAGEVRRVPNVPRRLAEASRLGFTRALVPPDSGELPADVKATVVPDLGSALAELSGPPVYVSAGRPWRPPRSW